MINKYNFCLVFTTIIIMFLLIGICSTAQAEEISKTEAYTICAVYIENQGSKYEGTKVPTRYSYQDLGKTHFLVWNMSCPILLANQYGGKRRAGAVCEICKKTGRIVYLAMSAREIIK